MGAMTPPPYRLRGLLLLTTALGAGVLGAGVPAIRAQAQPAPNAMPTGGVVTAGQAAIRQPSPNSTAIDQSSQRAVLEWQGFDIGSQHSVQFNQPNASAVVLNRVVGPDPSRIAGRLQANGQVIITNQSGVVFSRGAQVDTAGLVVSSAGIKTGNFMAGRMVFDQAGKPNAGIVNDGAITIRQSGLAALVAPSVANHGVISAPLGRVVLAGAAAHTVDLYGDGLVSIDVTGQVRTLPTGPDGKPVAALVTNTGTIAAAGGRVLLTARAVDGLVQTLVTAGGSVSADSVGARTGTIVAEGVGGSLMVTGDLSASGGSGARGGSIGLDATGAVTLAPGARIAANGGNGGGLIAIGSSLARAAGTATSVTGAAAAVADTAVISAGATVSADATGSGNGGRIAVLSTRRTAHQGRISARGGTLGGSGGAVEISSAGTLTLGGAVDVTAANPFGGPGTILIDPTNLEITDGTTTTGYDGTLTSAGFNALSGNVSLSATNDLLIDRTTLSLGTSAQSAVTLSAGHDLTVDGIIDLPGFTVGTTTVGQLLSLIAGNNLTVTNPINASGGVALLGSVSAAGTTSLQTSIDAEYPTAPATVTAGGGGIQFGSVESEGSFEFYAGALSMTTSGPVSEVDAFINASSLTGSVGALDLTGLNNDITALGSLSATGSLAIADLDALTVNGPVTAGGLLSLDLTAGLAGAGSSQALTLAGNLTAPAINLAGASVTQTAGVIATADLTATATVASRDAGANVSILLPDANLITGIGQVTADSAVLIGDAAPLTVTGPISFNQASEAQQTTSIAILDGSPASTTAYDLTLAGNLSANTIQLAASGNIVQATGSVLQADTLSGSSGGAAGLGNATLAGANTLTTLGSFASTGSLSLTNANTLFVDGPVSVGGALALAVLPPTGTQTAGGVTFSGSVAAGDLVLSVPGSVGQEGGPLTIAGSLSGSIGQTGDGGAGDLTLDLGVSLAGLGSLTATGQVLINDAAALSVTGPVTAQSGLFLTLNDSVGDGLPGPPLDLTLAGTLSAPTISLSANGNITQTAGALAATTLDVTAGSNAILGGANAVGTLAIASAGADFSLDDTAPISVGATVTAANISLASDQISLIGGSLAATGLLELAPDTLGAAMTLGFSGDSIGGGGGGLVITSTAGLSGTTLALGAAADSTLAGLDPHAGAITVAGSFAAGSSFTRLELDGTGAIAVNAPLSLTTPGTIALSGASVALAAAVDPGTALTLATTGAVLQTAGIVTATSLSGSVGGAATLPDANPIGTLGAFSAGGDLALTVADTGAFTVAGPVAVAGTATLAIGQLRADSVPGLTLAGSLAAGALVIDVAGGVVQTAGTLTAGSLSGTAGLLALGSSIAIANSVIGTLGNLSTTGSLALADQAPLAVTGSVAAATTLALTLGSTAVPAGLSLSGTLAAPSVNLQAPGATLTETGAGLIDAGTLSVGGVTALLAGANSVTSLGASTLTGNLSLADVAGLSIGGIVQAANVSLRSAALDVGGGAIDATGLIELAPEIDGTPMTLGASVAGAAGGYVLPSAVGLSGTTLRLGATANDLADPFGAVTAHTDALTVAGSFAVAAPFTRLELTTGSLLAVNAPLSLAAGGTIALTDTAAAGAGAITLAGDVAAPGGTLAFSTAGGVVQNAGILTAANLGGTVGSASLPDANAIGTIGTLTSAGDFALTDAQSLTVLDPVLTGGALSLQLTGSASTLTVLGDLTSTGALAVRTTGDVDLDATVTASQATLTADQALNLNGALTTAGPAVLTATSSLTVIGTLTASQAALTAGQSLDLVGSLAATGPVTLDAGSSLTMVGGVTAGALTASAGTSLSLTGSLTVAGLADLAAGGAISPNVALSVGTLSVNAGSAADFTSTANTVSTLGAVSTAGGFTLDDTTGLLVAGSVAAGPGPASAAGRLVPLTLSTPGSLAIAGTLSGGVVSLLAGGAITEAGTILAASLAGPAATAPAASAILTGNNTVASLGSFATAGNFTLSDAGPLAVTGPVTAATGSLTLAAGSLLLEADLGAPAIELTTTGAINQTAGRIATASLSGSAASASLPDANAVTTLAALPTPGGSFALSNAGPLAVTGPLTGTSVALSTTGGDLTLAGPITATGALSLDSTGAISQSAGTITAASLAGAAASTTLTLAGNTVAALESFTSRSGFALTDAAALTMTGPLDAGSAGASLAAPSLDLAGNVTAGTLSLAAATTLAQTAGTLSAGTLDASAGGLALGQGNTVGTLGAISSGGALSFTEAGSLTVAGPLVGSSVALSTGGGGLTLAGDITSAGALTLASSGAIAQTAGTLTAASLAGSAASVSLGDANAIATLGSFTSAGGFLLTDAGVLTVAGPLAGGAVSLSSTAASLELDGAITASTLSLTAGADIAQNGGALTAATLTGSADPARFNQAGNRVATLGSFTTTGAFSLNDAEALTIAGPLSAPSIAITAPGSITLAGNITTGAAPAGTTLTVMPDAAGAGTFSQVDTAAILPLAQSAAFTVVLPAAGGTASFADLEAPGAAVTLQLGSGAASGRINAGSLHLVAAGGSSAFTDSIVDGIGLGPAAAYATISPTMNAGYLLNGCIIGLSTCAVVKPPPPPPPPPPVTSPVPPGIAVIATETATGGRNISAVIDAVLATVLASHQQTVRAVPFINPLGDVSGSPLDDDRQDPDLRLPNVGEQDY